jgi:hypothetical protein
MKTDRFSGAGPSVTMGRTDRSTGALEAPDRVSGCAETLRTDLLVDALVHGRDEPRSPGAAEACPPTEGHSSHGLLFLRVLLQLLPCRRPHKQHSRQQQRPSRLPRRRPRGGRPSLTVQSHPRSFGVIFRHPERTGVTAVGRPVPDRVRRRSWVVVSRPWLLTLSRGWPVAAPVRGRPGPARPGLPRLRSSSAKLTLSQVPGKCARSAGRLSGRMPARCYRCRRPCRAAARRQGGRGSPARRSAGR